MSKVFLLVLGGIPSLLMTSCSLLGMEFTWSSETYAWGLNFTDVFVYWICNCTHHRNCSSLKFFLCVWIAFVLILMFFIFIRKKFLLGKLSSIEEKDACEVASFLQESSPYKNNFCLRMKKIHQHHNKGKPHTQEKYQGAAISVEDAIIIIRGLNLHGAHCTRHICIL